MEPVLVSVICPVINRFYSIGLLNAMYKNTKEKNWELILILDDYPDYQDYPMKGNKHVFSMLKEIFRDKKNVKFLKSSDAKYEFDINDKTFRVAATTNWGAANADGRFLLISNDDWYYTPYWLENYLAIINKVDMNRTIIAAINLESWNICEKDDDPKEKMWNFLREAGRRYMFVSRDISTGIDETELIDFWKNTRMDIFDVELNCSGPLGNELPIFILRSIWDSMKGRKLNGCSNATTDFHDRLQSRGFTKIVPRNIYIYNFLNCDFDVGIPVNYNWDRKDFLDDKNTWCL